MNPIQSRPFVFAVVFEDSGGSDAEAADSSLRGRSVVVAVERGGRLAPVDSRRSEKAARHVAEELAERAALQAIQKDLPHGFEPACSATPLDRLPDELRRRTPTLHTNQASAWLL